MTPFGLPILAQLTRETFEWGRIQSNTDWILPVVATVALLLYVRLMYERDAREHSRRLGWLLTALRSAAVFIILLLYLQPQWRVELERQVPSRALVLVDTSLSMGTVDGDLGSARRADQVVAALEDSSLLDQLRRRHDVHVFRFGKTLELVQTLSKLAPGQPEAAEPNGPGNADVSRAKQTDLATLLEPTASETWLGEALRDVVRQEQDAPVAGLILLSDGCQNAGPTPEAVLPEIREAEIPIFAVGIGSDKKAAGVRVSDFVVPKNAYPGDPYSVTGYLQAYRMAGRPATVELWARPTGVKDASADTLVETRRVTLGADGEVLPVPFTLTPDEKRSGQTLVLKVLGPDGVRHESDPKDVAIAKRPNGVLLLAGGPTREYRFLRNTLHRDKTIAVDVLLQTARPGVSQDARAVLEDFPATRKEMAEYDCVVALDPDWQALSAAQIDVLENWVAEQSGGLVIVAGPVNMGDPIRGWIQDDRMAKLRALCPVTFHRRFAVDVSGYASKSAWPIAFTREGQEAPFLWLADDALGSQQCWDELPGVYSCYPVRGPKPGATVYARFSDPQAASDGAPPVYMAGQFYGAGRVFYLGSGEMWRLRAINEAWFDTFYTKLIRHVSEGRLLRDSSRGVLLSSQDSYALGATVEVRAQLTDAQLAPLDAPSVTMEVTLPDGSIQTVPLRRDAARAGTFAGYFTARAEGGYELRVPVPGREDEVLSRRVQVAPFGLEDKNPERNDALLSKLAADTGGRYYVGLPAALGPRAPDPLVAQLPDRTKTIITPADPDRQQQQRWLGAMMLVLCGLLSAEWLLRRLKRLA